MKKIVLIFTLLYCVSLEAVCNVSVRDLRCEYKINPIGLSTSKPRLSWKMVSPVMNEEQTAYQIIAASSPKLLQPSKADMWNSQKVFSSNSIHIDYDGVELGSRHKCWWTVRIWDKKGKASDWSVPAYFETGLLSESDWVAEWIATAIGFENVSHPNPLLRKEFSVEKKVMSARLYATSHGLYMFYINGKKVGDELFTPGFTAFDKRVQYQVYDITAMLQHGVNAAGIMLGNGWKAFSKQSQGIRNMIALAQIEITFSDGSLMVVKTDESWRSSTGAILRSDIYNGEVYDARLEQSGWDQAGYDDSSWAGVEITENSMEVLTGSTSEPVRRVEVLKPVQIIYTPEGDTVFDMGQNMVGWCRLNLDCPEGTRIRLRHAEVLDKDGNFYTANLRAARQEIIYTCKGGGTEVYEPHFTYQGFRYVAISGYPKEVTKEIITGIVIHTDLDMAGTFSCRDEMINQLQHNILWGQKGNFFDIPTDCPQRNERQGWTGDVQIFAPTACFNMLCAPFYTKWMKDLAADQHEDGSVPWVIPNVWGKGEAHGWADAAVIVPWNVYLYYGDTQILKDQYESMKAWVNYVRGEAGSDYLWKPRGRQFGDWLAFATTRSDYPGATTDKDLTATAYFYHSTHLLSKIAGILGETDDAKDFEEVSHKIMLAFNKEYVTPNGRLSSNTQAAYVIALSFGLIPPDMEQMAAERLAADVNSFGHITTGFLGTPDILHILTKYGYLRESYRLLFRQDYPSWLYPITRGATTIWERWDGIKPDSTFQTETMNSFNHYAYGAVGSWLYRAVAGINPDPEYPGFKRFIIKPHPGSTMNDVAATYESAYGTIQSEWQIRDKVFSLSVSIPPNTSAIVFVPSKSEVMKINGQQMTEFEPVAAEGLSYHFLKTKLGSGRYLFETDF